MFGRMNHIFFLQTAILAKTTAFFQRASLHFLPEFATHETQSASVLPIVNFDYMPALKAAIRKCPSAYPGLGLLDLYFPAMKKNDSLPSQGR